MDVAGGAVLCERALGLGAATRQQCQLRCGRGYQSAFPPEPLLCSVQRRRWVSQPPQPHACQREWPQKGPPGVPLPASPGLGAEAFIFPPEGSVSMIARWHQSRTECSMQHFLLEGSAGLPRPLGQSFICGSSEAVCSLRHILLFLASMGSPGYRTRSQGADAPVAMLVTMMLTSSELLIWLLGSQ